MLLMGDLSCPLPVCTSFQKLALVFYVGPGQIFSTFEIITQTNSIVQWFC